MFDAYWDFYQYHSGIYVRKSDKLVGTHAVKVIGWGYNATLNESYWIGENQWGTKWGMNGFFFFRTGQCNFEEYLMSGVYVLHEYE